jgi:hypothetical protein
MAKRTHWMLAWCLAAGAGLGLAISGWGQAGERPLQKLFGGAAKSTPAKAAADVARRRVEVDLELAWIADPVTFPYFLEARIDRSTLSVRGYVPDKAVREHALKLARVYTTYTIADNMKEHASLRVRLAQESPTQLQAAVVSALREALPRQYQRLQVQCGSDGTVTLRGPIASAEEKLAASQALRRLYGCTSVQNQLRIPGEAEAVRTVPPVRDQDPLAALGPLVPKTDPEPTVQGPTLLPPKEPAPAVKKVEPPPASGKLTSGKLTLSAEKVDRLQKRILEVCAGARNVRIEITPMNKLRIELTVRSDDQITPFAGKVYELSELTDYRDAVELFFTVGQEK